MPKKNLLILFLLAIFVLPCRFCGKTIFWFEQENMPIPGDVFPSSGEVHLGKSGGHPIPGSRVVCEWCGASPVGQPQASELVIVDKVPDA